MSLSYWQEAVNSELQALLRNNTWSLCPLPLSRRSIGCKWLFRMKKKPDGSMHRYKAKLVAKGFSQHAGSDFCDTFSPVVQAALRAWFHTLRQHLVEHLDDIAVTGSSSKEISQKKYVLDLLHSKCMAIAIATPTPMVGSPKLTVADGSPLVDVHEYRSVIGKLQYVCIT
ncbi:hypothetical protein CXB51_001805 [Gossypium anomalum]|uniref:Reverse transcriptase Ty1/copia-type domain-containing protein n=1 Tax=Gossypium anomalum TaxID=47600 RepID=A0A8J6DC71_9ROSI|nr:hypothetical protein CXB51_001805 [Gossypium anomalum]